jgi:hypothetical protein
MKFETKICAFWLAATSVILFFKNDPTIWIINTIWFVGMLICGLIEKCTEKREE